MTEIHQIQKISHRLQSALLYSVELFREGSDNEALDCFLDFIDDLENMAQINQHFNIPFFKLDNIVASLKKLYSLMISRDITGIADTLEYMLCPVIKGLANGGIE